MMSDDNYITEDVEVSVNELSERKECPNKGLTYVWKLENFSHCTIPKGTSLSSPVFEDQSRWKLILYPRGNDGDSVECELKGETNSSFNIECQFCFCTLKNEIIYCEKKFNFTVSGQSSSSVAKFKREILENLPENTLVIHFHLWRVQTLSSSRYRNWKDIELNGSENSVHYLTPTRFGIQRIIFNWKVENFNSLSVGEDKSYRIPRRNDLTSFTLNLSLQGINVESAFIIIQLRYSDVKKQTFSTFNICVKDGHGRTRKEIQKEYWLSSDEGLEGKAGPEGSPSHESFSLRRRDLISGGSLNNTLVLTGEVTFSGDSEDILVYGMEPRDAIAAATGSKPQPLTLVRSPAMLPLLNGEGPASDFELRAAGRSFPVHQLVLWSQSSVFRAMLDNDMLEKSERRVELEDVDGDTVERMLAYAYAGVEPSAEMSWESLSELYSAADKYAFMGLRDLCAERLAKELDPVNAPGVLQVADRHGDSQLKEKVIEYIYTKGQVAIESEHWKKLEKDDPQLALEIFHKIVRDKILAATNISATTTSFTNATLTTVSMYGTRLSS